MASQGPLQTGCGHGGRVGTLMGRGAAVKKDVKNHYNKHHQIRVHPVDRPLAVEDSRWPHKDRYKLAAATVAEWVR